MESAPAIQLTPEQVNQFLANAILKSQLGDAVEASVKRVLGELSTSYKNPFDDVVRRHVHDAIQKLLLQNYQQEIEARVKDALAKALTDDAINKIIDAGLRAYR